MNCIKIGPRFFGLWENGIAFGGNGSVHEKEINTTIHAHI